MTFLSQRGIKSRMACNYTLLVCLAALCIASSSPSSLASARYLGQATRLDASLNQRRTATYKWVTEQEVQTSVLGQQVASTTIPVNLPNSNVTILNPEKPADQDQSSTQTTPNQTDANTTQSPPETPALNQPANEAPPAETSSQPVDESNAEVPTGEQESTSEAPEQSSAESPASNLTAPAESQPAQVYPQTLPSGPINVDTNTTSQPELDSAQVDLVPDNQTVEEAPPVDSTPTNVSITQPAQVDTKNQTYNSQQVDPPAIPSPVSEPPLVAPIVAQATLAPNVSQDKIPPVTAEREELEEDDESELDTGDQKLSLVKLDTATCNNLGPLTYESLNVTINRILHSLTGPNCTSQTKLKLKSNTNKEIRGQVMEVSSMLLELDKLLDISNVLVSCSKPELLDNNQTSQMLRLRLTMLLDVGDGELHSRWRSYSSLHLNDIPFDLFGGSSGARNSKQMMEAKSGEKCQKFRIEQGDFHLRLLSFKPELTFEVELVKQDDKTFVIGSELGGSVSLRGFKVKELYLDHEIEPHSVGLSRRIANSQLATVQILHDRNNHHRRNNWLLDLYGNWLRHEYKRQLATMLGHPLTRHLNYCLATST